MLLLMIMFQRALRPITICAYSSWLKGPFGKHPALLRAAEQALSVDRLRRAQCSI